MANIKIENLCKSFAGNVVLDHIDLTVEKGNICGLIGKNGSGKSVLLKCICGFLTPEEGTIQISGKTMNNGDARENMGILIETPGFLERETARNNLYFLAKLNGIIGKKEIDAVLQKVGLDKNDKKKVKKYSLGMRQRLGIAQAIMENPDILLLDEPMNSLDENGVKEMRELFLQLKREGKVIIIASHDMEDIRTLCDKVYRIKNKKLECVSVI